MAMRAQSQVTAPAMATSPALPQVQTDAAADKARTLGRQEFATADVMTNPVVQEAVLLEGAKVAQEAGLRGGYDPSEVKEREKKRGFSFQDPTRMGLIMFGLTLLSGGDITDALDNGMQIHNRLSGLKDKKKRQAASQTLIDSLPEDIRQIGQAYAESDQISKLGDLALASRVEGKNDAASEMTAQQMAESRQRLSSQLTRLDPSLTPDQVDALDYDTLVKQYSDKLFESRGVEKTDFKDGEWKAAETAFQMKLGADTIVEMLGDGLNNFDVGDVKRFEEAKKAISTAYVVYKSGAAFGPEELKSYDALLNWQRMSFDNAEANADAMQRLESLMQMLARRSNGAYGSLLSGPGVDLGVDFSSFNQPQTIDAGGIEFTVVGGA